MVADGYSRYEFEVFSGTAVSVNSTALQAPGNILLGLVRAIGLVKKPPVAAIHEFVLKVGDQNEFHPPIQFRGAELGLGPCAGHCAVINSSSVQQGEIVGVEG